jgi:hypothetical protein
MGAIEWEETTIARLRAHLGVLKSVRVRMDGGIMKKRIIWGLAGAVMLGLAAWMLWPTPFPVRAYERIRLGMTPDEVQATIGHAGQPAPPPALVPFRWLPFQRYVRQQGLDVMELAESVGNMLPSQLLQLYSEYWLFDDYCIVVIFRDGRAVGCYLLGDEPEFPPFLERLRAWVGL